MLINNYFKTTTSRHQFNSGREGNLSYLKKLFFHNLGHFIYKLSICQINLLTRQKDSSLKDFKEIYLTSNTKLHMRKNHDAFLFLTVYTIIRLNFTGNTVSINFCYYVHFFSLRNGTVRVVPHVQLLIYTGLTIINGGIHYFII